MSTPAATAAKPDATQQVLTTLTELSAKVDAQNKEITELKAKADQPVYKHGITPSRLFHATSGPVGQDSAGYSILKAAAYCCGVINEDQAKEEVATSKQLAKLYNDRGYQSFYQGKSFLVPASSEHIPGDAAGGSDKIKVELRQKMAATLDRVDPDEAEWIARKMNVPYWQKALGTLTDTAGGSLVGFPTLGELIDLQRNLEVFPSAGATEVTLPPNARLTFPKLRGGATAYNVGEAQSITSSQQTTGNLNLEGKKIGIMVPINNELMRYVGASAEALVRSDMARVGALKVDLDMLTGTGGIKMLGLLNYETTTSWSTGVDKLIAHTSVGTPASADAGYPFQPEDINLMDGKLPDAVDEGTAWIVRKDWFAYLLNRRVDSITAGDGKGAWVFDMWRSLRDKRPTEIQGTKVIRSRQVPNNRVRGNGTTFTLAIYGYFPDWIIGRFGVMEFLANPFDSNAFAQDQVLLRAIQIVDAGARHAASFVLCDQLAYA